MSQEEIITKVKEAVEEDPSRDYIQSISLFGSYLHGTANKDSDIDLLFKMRKTIGLFKIGGIQYRLEQKLGRKVDFVPENSVIPQLRDKIIPGAKIIYERK